MVEPSECGQPEPLLCGKVAAIRYTWPGEDEAVACVGCAEKLAAVAKALTMNLQLIPLTSEFVGEVTFWPTCPQRIKD